MQKGGKSTFVLGKQRKWPKRTGKLIRRHFMAKVDRNRQFPGSNSKFFITCVYFDRNYYNNLATRVIPVFIVSKSSLDETISEIVLPHFCKDPVFFQTCLNYTSLKHYGFKMQGK